MNNKCTLAIVIRNNSIPRDNIKVGTHTHQKKVCRPYFVSTHGHTLKQKKISQNELQNEEYRYLDIFVCCAPLGWPRARNMWKIFPLVPSKKPLTREN